MKVAQAFAETVEFHDPSIMNVENGCRSLPCLGEFPINLQMDVRLHVDVHDIMPDNVVLLVLLRRRLLHRSRCLARTAREQSSDEPTGSCQNQRRENGSHSFVPNGATIEYNRGDC